ncbi:uncharacterized protein [Apostichopus japonicus]
MRGLILCLVVAFAAFAAGTVDLGEYNPNIRDVLKLDGGADYKWGLRPLQTPEYKCWHLRFNVKSSDGVFIQFSTTDGDGSEQHYEVMIGAWGNKNTCIRKSTGQWLLDIRTPDILSDSEYTYFYIKQSYGRWSIGYQYGDEIASVYDDDVYEIKYVGIKSAKWSQWSLYWPGFGRDIFKTDIHDIGTYKWIFPEIPHKSFYFEFAVKAARDASIVFSPANEYVDDIYEIILGASDNLFVCIRRKKNEEPIVDQIALDIVNIDEYRYFWVSYDYSDDKSVLKVGRYSEEEPLAIFEDSDPLEVKYFGVTSYECKSWWKFYLLCPDHQYVCEHEQFHLHCDLGLVAVDYALYGRRNNAYCSVNGLSADSLNCGNPDDNLLRIQEACRGKQDCYIDAKNDFFGDPCVGTFKYLQISYSCCICN